MGCGPSVATSVKENGSRTKSGGGADIMLRADGTVRQLNDEQDQAQKLKAQQSAARLAAMMAELGLGDEYTIMSDTALLGALQRQWYSTTLELAADMFTPFLQATLMVAAADGLASDESRWLKARTLLLGLSEAQTNQLLQFDCGSNSMKDVLSKIHENHLTSTNSTDSANPLRRLIFYDGLTMASADGFSLDERVRASSAATLLGLTESEQDDIQSLVADEDANRHRKVELFTSDETDATTDATADAADGTSSAGGRRAAMQQLVYGVTISLDAELEVKYVSTLLSVGKCR